ncbi:unnamed protein product, partial [Mesorhabditis belari]|uniref:Uncharacterized protein n=1 Tax=Mesorhabditis belari TaxID=2138241 RepID=A0AAF3EZI4_9BILA
MVKHECRYQGCKIYTDSSSLRKHIKKEHGAEETGRRRQKKIEKNKKNKKKDCGSEDRESSHGPDSGGHLPENPGRVETVGMYDPNYVPNREGETNVANGNERPINGPGFTGYLTADLVNEETVELDAIEMGLSEARPEDNHIYRNANFVPLLTPTPSWQPIICRFIKDPLWGAILSHDERFMRLAMTCQEAKYRHTGAHKKFILM